VSTNESAFPVVPVGGVILFTGLTKRELFATMALQGLCANSAIPAHLEALAQDAQIRREDVLPFMAIESADALLKALGEAK
jgi:hypothetical protein